MIALKIAALAFCALPGLAMADCVRAFDSYQNAAGDSRDTLRNALLHCLFKETSAARRLTDATAPKTYTLTTGNGLQVSAQSGFAGMVTGWQAQAPRQDTSSGVYRTRTKLDPCTGRPIPARGGGGRGPAVHMEVDGRWFVTLPLDETLSDSDVLRVIEVGKSVKTGVAQTLTVEPLAPDLDMSDIFAKALRDSNLDDTYLAPFGETGVLLPDAVLSDDYLMYLKTMQGAQQ